MKQQPDQPGYPSHKDHRHKLKRSDVDHDQQALPEVGRADEIEQVATKSGGEHMLQEPGDRRQAWRRATYIRAGPKGQIEKRQQTCQTKQQRPKPSSRAAQ